MGRKTGLFVPILLIGGIFFFSLLGILMLDHAPAVDENRTPALAETANKTAMFHDPVQLGWQGAIYVVIACALIAVLGLVARRLGGRRRLF